MEKVSVLLSVYRPNQKYLEEQLASLDNQTYENMEILIFDDCVKERCSKEIFERCLKKKPYRILPYKEKNLGYTKAFEYLTENSDGDYIAFCDQDDVWHNEKIEKCVNCLNKDETLLVATDRSIIDEKGELICSSVRHTSHSATETWNTYEDIGIPNLFMCYSPGMSLVARGDFVRSTVPFSIHTGHDKWVISCACAMGRVSYLDQPLAAYRRHGKNVSGVLAGIHCKKDYQEKRVVPNLKLVQEFIKRYPEYKGNQVALAFARARVKHNIPKLIKYRHLSPDIAKFEILLALMPDFVMKICIRILQRKK